MSSSIIARDVEDPGDDTDQTGQNDGASGTPTDFSDRELEYDWFFCD